MHPQDQVSSKPMFNSISSLDRREPGAISQGLYHSLPSWGPPKHHQMALFFFSRMLHTWSSTNSIQHLRFWNPSPQTWKQIWKQQKTTTALIKSTPSPQAETISDISGEAILRPHGFCRTTNLLVVIPVGIPGLRDGISDIILLSLDKWSVAVACCRLLWKFGGNYRMVPPSYVCWLINPINYSYICHKP